MAPPPSPSFSRVGKGRNERLVENVTQHSHKHQTSCACASSTRRCPRDRKSSDESRTRQKSPADGSFDEAIRLLPRRCRCSGPNVPPLTMNATARRRSTTSTTTTPEPLFWVRAFSSSSSLLLLLLLLPLKSLLLSVVRKSDCWTVSEGAFVGRRQQQRERWSLVELNAYVYLYSTPHTTPALDIRKDDLVMRDRRLSQFVG
jgi:hypothetical protein